MTGATFKEQSKKTVAHFLQTVMVIDDGLFYVKDLLPSGDLASPDEQDAINEREDSDATSATPISTPVTPPLATTISSAIEVNEDASDKESPYELDAKELVDAFAKKGIICATVKPDDDGELLDTVKTAIENVDFVVLDWRVNGQKGVDALKIIKHFCEADSAHTHRVRLVAIYSGDPDLEDIGNKVCESLSGATKRAELVFDKGPVRISIFGKHGATIKKDELKNRYLRVEDLPDALVAEFTDKTSGLVSNTVLRALSAIRDNTYRLLSRLNRNIDPAFLAHRSLLPQPEDAGEHLLVLITEELRSILEENEIANYPSWAEIEAWLDEHYEEVTEVKPTGDNWTNKNPIAKEVLLQLLKQGVRKWDSGPCAPTNRKNNAKLRRLELSQLFCRGEEKGRPLDNEWSILMSMKTRYGPNTPPPSLTLGSIVKRLRRNPNPSVSPTPPVSSATTLTAEVTGSDVSPSNTENKGSVETRSTTAANVAGTDGTPLAIENKDSFETQSDPSGSLVSETNAAQETPKPVPIQDDEYLLCIQPRCDAVRLIEPTQFLFLRMTKPKIDRKDEFTHVVEGENNEYVQLILGSQVKDLTCIVFQPSASQQITASLQADKFILRAQDNQEFEWVGELKYAPGQRDATSFASSLSRPGLDESEWVRISALGLRGITELILLTAAEESNTAE